VDFAVVARGQVINDDRILLQQPQEVGAVDDEQPAGLSSFHRSGVDAGHKQPQVIEGLPWRIGACLAGDTVGVDGAREKPPLLDNVEAVGHVALVGDDRVRLEGVLTGDARDGRLGSFAQIGEERQTGDELLFGGHEGILA